MRADAACDLAAYRPGDNGTLFSPQGGLRISVAGLATIGRLLLGQGRVDGVRLLSAASVRTLLAPVWSGGASGETYGGQMRCFGIGVQCLVGGSDQPVAGRRVRWQGHLGEAYGLYSGLWVDSARRRVYAFAVTGTAADLGWWLTGRGDADGLTSDSGALPRIDVYRRFTDPTGQSDGHRTLPSDVAT